MACQLATLNLAYTQRNLQHFPPDFMRLRDTLTDLDLAGNGLAHLPVPLLALEQLTRLNLAYNRVCPGVEQAWRLERGRNRCRGVALTRLPRL